LNDHDSKHSKVNDLSVPLFEKAVNKRRRIELIPQIKYTLIYDEIIDRAELE
jgi:hypothetical protein